MIIITAVSQSTNLQGPHSNIYTTKNRKSKARRRSPHLICPQAEASSHRTTQAWEAEA